GFRVTPKMGATVVTSLRLCTANDAEPRDPITYELSGSNESIDGPYTLIAKGNIVDFAGGTAWPRRTWSTTPMRFANTTSYLHYQLMFPTVRAPASANSMQIAEVELLMDVFKATAPNPANGGVITMPLFQWAKGDTAMFHDVYFGTGPDLTEADRRATRMPATVAMYYHVLPLEPGVTYYWRVDQIDAAGKVYTGDVWSVMMAPKKAYNPRPIDGDKWLPVNTQLSWTPGAGATSHEVFFGPDKQAVANRSASVAKGTTIAPNYDPKALQQNTTYYWAVDETAAGVKYPGDVWEFSTLGGGGGARGEYFVGASVIGTPVLSRIDSQVNINTTGGASPGPGVPGDTWSARWTADLDIAVAGTYTFSVNCFRGTRLWIDEKLIIDQWVGLATGTVTSEYFAVPLFLERGIHSLRLEFFTLGAGSAVAQLYWSTATMAKVIVPAGPLQPPLRARAVNPANQATGVQHDVVLVWGAGEKAVKHNVYFGDNAQAVAAATPASPVFQGAQAKDKTSFTPGKLEWNKTYYWRVDEVNDASADSPWKGTVWSFTTADFLVVDNMESYTDDEGNRIYESWIDGWTNKSGSVVGYLQAPFAEQTVVHTGRQAMPLEYDNTKAPFYSEAELVFAPTQDWTVNGVNTLVLFVRGLAANGAGPVFVAVEDSTGRKVVVTNPDATLVTRTAWTEWKVPLSQFTGVNAARVKKLYVGVGNRQSPAAGGAGRIYIDDIRVTRP
ncbi:MAG: hypothetical protein FJ280_21840, partial [Planctomycetes bacterium]|nr:hypothetical protein [Planctomycetota bacterium]